ncbi:2-dehydropantoate 2-reductase [Aminivibrio sp.]|jgi:2-dehydropantoate 2-reductase|uniref:ketopantoate reductase family protein n=1 Tax=Aminivibrio sp. TaxID=1872489 RepID=UPI001A4C3C34|nr:2-dehydropantoate 2-reductase [Aminivibrio sp.]MBL3540222.1 2-dehydropantoate 2-reductase [Aminivibrio sp.]
MKIVFVGLGGVGGYYGGKAARAFEGGEEHQVMFLARGEHLRAIKDKGLKVLAQDEEFFARPFLATDDPAEIGTADLVVFAVKGYDLRAAARTAVPLVGPDTAVLPLLNGVTSPEVLSEALPPCRMLNGCVYISARIEGPGVVRQTGGSRKLLFGPVSGARKQFLPVEEMLRKAGIDAALVEDVNEAVWTKFIFMAPFAGVTSLFGRTFGEVLAGQDSQPMLEGMMREIQSLAVLKGVSLPPDIVELSLAKGVAFPPDTKSSMQLDCEKGRRTEIETLLGFVVKEGERLGGDVHLTRGVYDALRMRADHPCGCVTEQEGQRP